jgi:hypothetical protein
MPRHYRDRKSHRKGSRRNVLNKTFNKSVTLVKSTSKRYMPKVKHSLENVGSKVIKTGEQSVPFLQSLTRKVFSTVGIKKGRRSNRKHR